VPISPKRISGCAVPDEFVWAQEVLEATANAFVVSNVGLADKPGSDEVSEWLQMRMSPSE
jgi:hypothetical protein